MTEEMSTTTLHHLVPYAASLDVEIESATSAVVTATAPWSPDRCTVGGALHGGYLMGVADTVGAVAAFLNLPAGAATATIESKTNFFRPATSGPIRIATEILHAGKRTIVVQTDITNEHGKLITRTIQTQSVLADGS